MSRINFKKLVQQKWYIEHFDGCPAFTEMTGGGLTLRFYNSKIPYNEVVMGYYRDRQGDWFSLFSEQETNARAIFFLFLKNRKAFVSLNKKWTNDLRKIKAFYFNSFKHNLRVLNNQRLLEWTDNVYNFYRNKISVPGFIDGFILYAGQRFDFLIKKFCRQHKIKNFSKISLILSAPITPSFFKEAQDDLKKIMPFFLKSGYKIGGGLTDFLERDGNKKMQKLIDEHILRFSWIKSSYAGYKEYGIGDVEKEIKELAGRKVPNRKKDTLIKNKTEKEELIKRHGFKPEIIAILRANEAITKIQEERKFYSLTFVALQEKILREISRRTKINKELLLFCRLKEVSTILDGEFDIDELKKRQKSSLFIYQRGEVNDIFTGKIADEFLQKVGDKLKSRQVKEITGIIVSPGKAEGIVKIIKSVKDLAKINQGDILVAGMTRPEHLPGMKKAAAIVTDDGGITCHAAIISRELNKPCIVGTKIATKVLKDGQLVEVDANKGIVRIIK